MEKGRKEEPVGRGGIEFRDPVARMFDATLEVLRLLSATIAACAQWRKCFFN